MDQIASKETIRLKKLFLESHLKDLKKCEGKYFMETVTDDDENEIGCQIEITEATAVHKVTDRGTFIVSIVEISDSFSSISVNEEVDLITGEECEKEDFDDLLQMAQKSISKRFGEEKEVEESK